jgi:hypothetical protein
MDDSEVPAIKSEHESGVVPGIKHQAPIADPAEGQHPVPGQFLTGPDDTSCGNFGVEEPEEQPKRVRFIDDPEHPRGRGRLDLSSGEYIR